MDYPSRPQITVEKVALGLADEFLPERTKFTVKEYFAVAVDQSDPKPFGTLESFKRKGSWNSQMRNN